MLSAENIPYVQMIPESRIAFDLQKVQQVYDNYIVNYHAGLTLVMGHPFKDTEFRVHILKVQNAISEVFKSYGLQDLLILYDVDSQVHATLVELANQHDKEKNGQNFLVRKSF